MPELTPPANEPRETRLRRLRMRSWRRGTKEMDMILGAFADHALADLSDPELDAHEALMAENDQDLYLWISGAKPAPEHLVAAVERVQRFVREINSV